MFWRRLWNFWWWMMESFISQLDKFGCISVLLMLNLIKPPRFAHNSPSESWGIMMRVEHKQYFSCIKRNHKKVETKLNIDCTTPYWCLRWLQGLLSVSMPACGRNWIVNNTHHVIIYCAILLKPIDLPPPELWVTLTCYLKGSENNIWPAHP